MRTSPIRQDPGKRISPSVLKPLTHKATRQGGAGWLPTTDVDKYCKGKREAVFGLDRGIPLVASLRLGAHPPASAAGKQP